ncbi:MAG: phage portal protein [Caulobacteraceae bacterium]
MSNWRANARRRPNVAASSPGFAGRLWNRMRTAFAPLPAGRVIRVGRGPAGVFVDAETALKEATVWACVQYLSRTVAQLPWRVGIETEDGGFKIADTHPADWLLRKRPSAEMGSFTLRQTLMASALRRGNGYAEIERDNRGAPYALWFIHSDRVQPRRAAGGGLDYEVYNAGGGGSVMVPGEDMLHIRGFGEGPVGVNVIEYAAESIGWARATEIFGASYFGEGMNPSGIVTTEKGLTPEAMEILRAEMEGLYKGPRGKRTAILDAKMKFEKVAATPEDSQFIETRQHQVEEICRWFAVPPHKVMHLLRATFSNIEQQSIEVVVDSIMPWVKTFEEEADYKLFGPNNRQGFCTRMNLRGLLRGDSASRSDYYWQLWQMGALTINDILRLEDMNTIGPDGDIRFVPGNMTTLARARAATDTATGEAATGEPPAVVAPAPAGARARQAARRALNGVLQH